MSSPARGATARRRPRQGMMLLLIAAALPSLWLASSERGATAKCAPVGRRSLSFKVLSCVKTDPESDSIVSAYAKKYGDSDVIRMYRGIVLEVERTAGPKPRRTTKPVTVDAWKTPNTYFIPAGSCAAFPVGSEHRATYYPPCCDGDPEVPCLYQYARRHAATKKPKSKTK